MGPEINLGLILRLIITTSNWHADSGSGLHSLIVLSVLHEFIFLNTLRVYVKEYLHTWCIRYRKHLLIIAVVAGNQVQ